MKAGNICGFPALIIIWALPREALFIWLERQGDKIVFVTEGPLKGDIAHALSGRTFVCVPGVNQYANLPAF